jgi:ferredoxin-like protein FixX
MASAGGGHKVRPMENPRIPVHAYSFATVTGRIAVDHAKCPGCQTKGCVGACAPKILKIEDGKPVLAISEAEAKKGKCTECLACEIYCSYHERQAIVIDLPIPGLKEYRDRILGEKIPE